MHMTYRTPLLAALAVTATLAAGTATAQNSRQEASQQYREDVQWCRQNAQDRLQNCLQEARAAQQEYRRDADWYEPSTGSAATDSAGETMRAARADRG
jgi:hypothetical protein